MVIACLPGTANSENHITTSPQPRLVGMILKLFQAQTASTKQSLLAVNKCTPRKSYHGHHATG